MQTFTLLFVIPQRSGDIRFFPLLLPDSTPDSQRPQIIQNILLLLRGQPLEPADHAIGLRARTGMILNRRQQAPVRRCRTSVVQEV